MSFKVTIPLVASSFFSAAALASGASFLWVEKPAGTNFPNSPTWDILSEKRAPGVIDVKDSAQAESFFIEYEIDVPSPGGEYRLWGRSYDPNWSSPARWRLDDDPWQEWKPGKASDRAVALKTFAMEWRPWSDAPIALAPGRHRLRLELTGTRKQGNVPFFVLDAILLTRGDFAPKGATKPDEMIREQCHIAHKLADSLAPAEAASFKQKADAIAKRASEEDLGAYTEFALLQGEMERGRELENLLKQNKKEALHGKLIDIQLSSSTGEPTLTLQSQWNRPWKESKLWVGFLQNGALYGWALLPPPSGRTATQTLPLPKGLPAGRLTVRLVPIEQPLASAATGSFELPEAHAHPHPLAHAWGIYRDSSLRAHPWSVNDSGLMIWNGSPYIPVGGMINTRNTWGTFKGDDENSPNRHKTTELLRAQLATLRAYGLRDIYFNAFFPRSDPSALASTINAAEEAGMRYGLHVASIPAYRSLGFQAATPIPVPAGRGSCVIQVSVDKNEIRSKHRVLWSLFTSEGRAETKGSGILTAGQSTDPKEKGKATLSLEISFPPSGKDRTLVFTPEVVMGSQDVIGYSEGIDEYISNLRETYGSLSYGPGMRLWIDPFINELHARPVTVCMVPTIREAYQHWLFKRYGTIEALNDAWQRREGDALTSFEQATRLVPMHESGNIVTWMDSEALTLHGFAGGSAPSPSLRDLKLFRGVHAQKTISRVADVLKSIANVPVILKHNTFFNDWFINPDTAGGQDGLGYEPYCYGDSLAYHNSLVPFAQALASGRCQWTLVTETSAAAFNGQKDYVGYLDRIQLLNDFDQLLKFGAKGFYTFGFAFDPPLNFQISELLRDPRQLEWFATYRKTLDAAPGLASYLPEVYGWYPAYLRERQIVHSAPPPYAMHGNYTQRVAQIRMAPDGRWIVPAMHLNARWKGVLAAADLLTPREKENMAAAPASLSKWVLGSQHASSAKTPPVPLNAFTANGIGLISGNQPWMTLDEFREKILGYRVFQTEALNGQTLPDGRLMVWTCVERDQAEVRLPAKVEAVNLAGQPIELTGVSRTEKRLVLTRPPYKLQYNDLPAALGHLPNGSYYPDTGQPEVAILSHVSVEEVLALQAPAWHRWLPKDVRPEQVAAWQEAESPEKTTFLQPRVEGYSRYSGPGGAAIGINSYFKPPKGESWYASYTVQTREPGNARTFWLRRMNRPAMDLEIHIDGALVGTILADQKPSDALHLNPWNAGIGVNNIKVGWHRLDLPLPLGVGPHAVKIVAKPVNTGDLKADTQLLGGQSDAAMEAEAATITGLQCVQIDAFMLTK